MKKVLVNKTHYDRIMSENTNLRKEIMQLRKELRKAEARAANAEISLEASKLVDKFITINDF